MKYLLWKSERVNLDDKLYDEIAPQEYQEGQNIIFIESYKRTGFL
jgi:hypothetical protein